MVRLACSREPEVPDAGSRVCACSASPHRGPEGTDPCGLALSLALLIAATSAAAHHRRRRPCRRRSAPSACRAPAAPPPPRPATTRRTGTRRSQPTTLIHLGCHLSTATSLLPPAATSTRRQAVRPCRAFRRRAHRRPTCRTHTGKPVALERGAAPWMLFAVCSSPPAQHLLSSPRAHAPLRLCSAPPVMYGAHPPPPAGYPSMGPAPSYPGSYQYPPAQMHYGAPPPGACSRGWGACETRAPRGHFACAACRPCRRCGTSAQGQRSTRLLPPLMQRLTCSSSSRTCSSSSSSPITGAAPGATAAPGWAQARACFWAPALACSAAC